jgi:hydrogenase/urease accessory protein HupE
MKTLRRPAFVAAAFAAPLSAFAHPGHDGDHDFTWTFSHLVAHPLATLGCLALIAIGACVAWRIARWSEHPATVRRPRP